MLAGVTAITQDNKEGLSLPLSVRCRFCNSIYHPGGCRNITVIVYNVNCERFDTKERNS